MRWRIDGRKRRLRTTSPRGARVEHPVGRACEERCIGVVPVQELNLPRESTHLLPVTAIGSFLGLIEEPIDSPLYTFRDHDVRNDSGQLRSRDVEL